MHLKYYAGRLVLHGTSYCLCKVEYKSLTNNEDVLSNRADTIATSFIFRYERCSLYSARPKVGPVTVERSVTTSKFYLA